MTSNVPIRERPLEEQKKRLAPLTWMTLLALNELIKIAQKPENTPADARTKAFAFLIQMQEKDYFLSLRSETEENRIKNIERMADLIRGLSLIHEEFGEAEFQSVVAEILIAQGGNSKKDFAK
jgi:hypothetical protein